jgi:hypothetical protein
MSRTNDLTEAVKRYLILRGIFCWRNNTVGVYDPVRKVYRLNKGQLRGVADILGIMPDGTFIAVEIKTGRDRLSEYQIAYREEVRNHNAIYIEAHTIDDVINYFENTNDATGINQTDGKAASECNKPIRNKKTTRKAG